MSHDEELASRVRRILADAPGGVAERRMFGGLCFMVGGRLCCGVLGDELIVKVGAERQAGALARPHARVFDLTGRASRGMVYVGPGALGGEAELRRWVRAGMRDAAEGTDA